MPDKTPVQIYREAADLIEKDAWVQGAYRSPLGCWCLSGAIAFVAGGLVGQIGIAAASGGSEAFYERLSALETCLLPGDVRNIVGWNDTPGRTVEEVITLLRDRADQMEAEHG